MPCARGRCRCGARRGMAAAAGMPICMGGFVKEGQAACTLRGARRGEEDGMGHTGACVMWCGVARADRLSAFSARVTLRHYPTNDARAGLRARAQPGAGGSLEAVQPQ
eukprot:294300-Chlamydomonas_euryale.AAC.1